MITNELAKRIDEINRKIDQVIHIVESLSGRPVAIPDVQAPKEEANPKEYDGFSFDLHVGAIVNYKGKKYEVVKETQGCPCLGCSFCGTRNCPTLENQAYCCLLSVRTDGISVIFVERKDLEEEK